MALICVFAGIYSACDNPARERVTGTFFTRYGRIKPNARHIQRLLPDNLELAFPQSLLPYSSLLA